jgi:hypothetical protein
MELLVIIAIGFVQLHAAYVIRHLYVSSEIEGFWGREKGQVECQRTTPPAKS